MNIDKIIKHFKLAPHIEGGYYAESYRSTGKIPAPALPDGYGEHTYSTGIYFLLKQGDYSHFHRIKQDEMWHFYLGQPLRIAMLYPNGTYQEIILGNDFINGQYLQFVVPAGVWFGATPCKESKFSFVGCTVAPGFEFSDFELARKKSLIQEYPEHSQIICEFTKEQ